MAVRVRQRDPVLDRLLRDALHAEVDRQLEASGRPRNADDVGGADRAALCVHHDACLLEAAVQQSVVCGLGAGLADDHPGAGAAVGVLRELRGADLAEQAEELAPERAARVAPLGLRHDADSRELPRMLVEEVAEIATDARQDDRRRVRRLELAVADPLDHQPRRGAREVAEPAQELAALTGRPPATVVVDDAEDGGVDRDAEPASCSGEDAALRVDDLATRGGQVDQPERLLLGRRGEMRPAHDLQRPEA